LLLLYLYALITLAHLHVIMALVRLDGGFYRRREGRLLIFHLVALFTLAHVHSTMAIVGLDGDFAWRWGGWFVDGLALFFGPLGGQILRWESGWRWGCFLADGTASPLVGLFLLHDSPAVLGADRIRDLPHLLDISLSTCSYHPLHLSSFSIYYFGLGLHGRLYSLSLIRGQSSPFYHQLFLQYLSLIQGRTSSQFYLQLLDLIIRRSVC